MELQAMMKNMRFMHRLSGLLLIPLILLKILSGYGLVDKIPFFQYATAVKYHVAQLIDIPLLLFFLMHGAFGVLRIILPKLKNKTRSIVITFLIAFLFFALAIAFLYIV